MASTRSKSGGCGCVSEVSDCRHGDCWFSCLDFASTIRRDCLGHNWPLASASRSPSHEANSNLWSAEALLQGGSAAPAPQDNTMSGRAEKLSCPFQLPCPGLGGRCDGRRTCGPLWSAEALLPHGEGVSALLPGMGGGRSLLQKGAPAPARQHSGATRPRYYRPSFLFRCSTHFEAQPPDQRSHSNAAAPISWL